MPGHRVAEHLLRDAGVGVACSRSRSTARASQAAQAPQRDRERDDDPVADPQLSRVDAGADLDDLAHELVAHDVALLHRRHVAVEQVQVGAADRRRGDLHDRVAALRILGSGTSLDLDLVRPDPAVGLHACTSFALVVGQRLGGVLRELLAGPLAPRGAVGPHHLAGLDDLLEPAQVVVELLGRVLAEVLRHGLAERAAGHVVAQRDVHLGARAVRGGHEADLPRVGDVGALRRAPGDLLAGHVLGRLGVPLDGLAERRGRPSSGCVRCPCTRTSSRCAMNVGRLSRSAPERVHLRRWFADGGCCCQLHGSSLPEPRTSGTERPRHRSRTRPLRLPERVRSGRATRRAPDESISPEVCTGRRRRLAVAI